MNERLKKLSSRKGMDSLCLLYTSYTDVQEFVQRMQSESIDMKQLGLIGRTKNQILDELKDLYIAQ